MSDDHNPYVTNQGECELKESVVVFVDILGYQALIRTAHMNGIAQTLLSKLHLALTSASRNVRILEIIMKALEFTFTRMKSCCSRTHKAERPVSGGLLPD